MRSEHVQLEPRHGGGSAPEAMSNVDRAWLRMDEPTNPMMITAVFTLDGLPSPARLAATLEHRLLRYERFRQHLLPPRHPLGPPRWALDPHFDLRAHLHTVALPAPGDDTALAALVSDLMSTALDRARPLWQLHRIEGYQGGGAIVARLHHCIGDGAALLRVLATLTDDAPDTPLARPARPALALVHARTPHGPHPAAALAALGRLVLRPGDPPTVLKGALGVRKLAAWSTPVPLETVRAIGHAVGGTVNDALTAAVAGMLRRHLLARREPIVTRSLRAIVPVDLHPPEAGTHLGNRFGLVFAALPVGLDDPLARLHAVKHGMDALKHSSESTVALGLLHALGMLNASVERMAVSLFGHKASLVLTDLPGPQAPRYLAGERIRSAMFWPPQAGHLGLGVSLLSYAGEVRVGIAADAGLVPSPADLAADFVREIDALRACTGLLH